MSTTVVSRQVAAGEPIVLSGVMAVGATANSEVQVWLVPDESGGKPMPVSASFSVQPDENGNWTLDLATAVPKYGMNWDGAALAPGNYEVRVMSETVGGQYGYTYEYDDSAYELVVYLSGQAFATPTAAQGKAQPLEPVLGGVASDDPSVTTTVTVSQGGSSASYVVQPGAGTNVWTLDLRTASPISTTGVPLVLEGEFDVVATSTDGQNSFGYATDLLLVDPPSVPEIDPVTIDDAGQAVITGTADPREYFTTEVSVGFRVVEIWGAYTQTIATYRVAVEPDGTWSLDLATAVPASLGWNSQTQNYYESISAGVYEIDVATTGRPGYVRDATQDELDLGVEIEFPVAETAAPTVDAAQFEEGAPVSLSGTADPALPLTIDIVLGKTFVVEKAAVLVERDGSWSFDVSAYLSGKNLPALVAGTYEVRVVSQNGAGSLPDTSKLELTILEASGGVEVPTIDELEISGYDPDFSLTGTASTQDGAVTVIRLHDDAGNWYGRIVTPDENGAWSIGMNDAMWHNGTSGDTTWGMTLEALVYAAGTYDFEATTSLGEETATDSTQDEVTKLDPPAPTVDENSVAQGEEIVLTGTGRPDASVSLYLYDADRQFVTSGSTIVDAEGNWSFNVSQKLAGSDLDPLSPGQYEVELTVSYGWEYYASDNTTLELTVVPPSTPTAGADNLAGAEGDDVVDLLAGDDVYSGGDGADTITGGAGRDELAGDGGDDLFVVGPGDLEDGEIHDGGDGVDTLELRGGGSFDLSAVSLASIERIVTTDVAGTTLTVADLVQAKLLASAAGASDVLVIENFDQGSIADANGLLLSLLGGAGVEEIRWSEDGRSHVARSDGKKGVTIVDEEGGFEERLSVDSKGFQTATRYENGKRIETSTHDALDTVAYESITSVFGDDGKLLSRTRINDDGTQSVTEYVNGAPVRQVMTDNSADGGAAAWKSFTIEYDAKGKPASKTQVNDDDTRIVTTYEGGKPSGKTVTDESSGGAGAKWSTVTTVFGEDGRPDSIVTVFDKSSSMKTQTVEFGETGLKTAIEQEYADGRHALTEYDDAGRIESRLTQDLAEAYSWTSKLVKYDAAGNVASIFDLYDSGNVIAKGGAGADIVYGGDFDDTLWGLGGADDFVYSGGVDRIRDFSLLEGDRLDLSEFGVADLAGLGAVATVSETARAVVLDFGDGDILRVDGLHLADLSDTDLVGFGAIA